MGDPTSSQPEARTSPQPTPLCKAPCTRVVPCLDSIRDESPDNVKDEARTYWRFAGQEEVEAGLPQGLPAGKEKGGRELSFLWGRGTHFPAAAPSRTKASGVNNQSTPLPSACLLQKGSIEAEPLGDNMTMGRNYTQQHGKTSYT